MALRDFSLDSSVRREAVASPGPGFSRPGGQRARSSGSEYTRKQEKDRAFFGKLAGIFKDDKSSGCSV